MSQQKLLFEQIDVLSKEADFIHDLITKSYPNECIMAIYKVNNPVLEYNYEQRKEMLTNLRRKSPEERNLFHGGSFQSCVNISQRGFLKDYNKVSAYGRGTYFSNKHSMSRGYAISKNTNYRSFRSKYTDNDSYDPSNETYDCVMIAKVLTGVLGRAGNNQEIDTDTMDCSVDDLRNPSIFCIPYDDSCLPLYFVQFHRG